MNTVEVSQILVSKRLNTDAQSVYDSLRERLEPTIYKVVRVCLYGYFSVGIYSKCSDRRIYYLVNLVYAKQRGRSSAEIDGI